ncbi:MAG: VOC family protein [Chitinophagaceae bacterium]|nr:VOC family protein [Chitinophagaceae bacterium]MBX3257585.1 VOC family protein [Chitinophagaceae bacterium]
MFEGKAEEAINFYISLFSDSGIVSITRYASGEPGDEGTVRHAVFSLGGQQYMAIDSAIKHGFTFTPSMSLFVTCDTAEEIDILFEKLSGSGKVLMPLDKYPGLKKFGWISDKFGVSWQLNLK